MNILKKIGNLAFFRNFKAVWRVFLTDARRLSKNVVALIIIMGLSIIPALYAWFNIMSNWDPYGTSATSKMEIGVYSLDEGFTYGDLTVCIGDTIVESLEANDVINWQFPDSEEETMEGVYSGDYYAALIIPENFTTDMLSFIGGDPTNPVIEYWENSKKNAIATKITSKVKTTVQQSVNSSIMSSITEVVSQTGEILTGESSDGTDVLAAITENISDVSSDLTTYENILNSLIVLTDSANGLVDSTDALLPCISSVIQAGSDSIDGMNSSIDDSVATAEALEDMVSLSLNTMQTETKRLQTTIEDMTDDTDTEEVQEVLDSTTELVDATLALLDNYKGQAQSAYNQAVEDLRSNYGQLSDDIDQFTSDADVTKEKLEALQASTADDFAAINTAITNVTSLFTKEVAPTLNVTVDEIQDALSQANTMLSNVDASFPEVSQGLSDYSATIEDAHDKLVEGLEYITDLHETLDEIESSLEALSGDAKYAELVAILQTDPSTVGEFVTSPLNIKTEKIYEIDNYGSAMAPFYTVLALWVGGLIMTALLHVKVKDCPEVEGTKDWHRFFGRYQVFFFTAEAQTLIVVMGDLFFVDIQCLHPFKFWLAAAVMSFMFSFFMYALTAAWGNIGQAIAVIVMVIQVAGAGGTFPIEVLPKAYQMVYKYLPFVYSMNALRECVGGTYQNYYWTDLGVLGIYILLSVPLGLFLGKPFKKLIAALEESKKKSGVMM